MSLSRFIKGSLTLGLIIVTSGCAWYQGLEWPYQERENRFGERSLIDQDPEIRKFYELQKRINDLEQRLDKTAETNANRQAMTTVNQKAEAAMAYIKGKTREAIAIIDNLLSNLETQANQKPSGDGASSVPELAVSEPERTPVNTETQDSDIAGTLERDEAGEVVGSTDQGNRYNYSVVYVYPETKPWFDMWALLEENGVRDKWRGKNETKNTWFIYVGAYYTQHPAESRSDQLVALTGETPEIRMRDGYRSVAMQ